MFYYYPVVQICCCSVPSLRSITKFTKYLTWWWYFPLFWFTYRCSKYVPKVFFWWSIWTLLCIVDPSEQFTAIMNIIFLQQSIESNWVSICYTVFANLINLLLESISTVEISIVPKPLYCSVGVPVNCTLVLLFKLCSTPTGPFYSAFKNCVKSNFIKFDHIYMKKY